MKVTVNKNIPTLDFEPISINLVIQTESELVDLFNRVSARPELFNKDKEYKHWLVNDHDTQVLFDVLCGYIEKRKISREVIENVQSNDADKYM